MGGGGNAISCACDKLTKALTANIARGEQEQAESTAAVGTKNDRYPVAPKAIVKKAEPPNTLYVYAGVVLLCVCPELAA